MNTNLIMDESTGEIQPLFRTMYNYDRDAATKKTATICKEETRTQQHFKDECDINKIMERFGVTGTVPQKIRPVMQEEFEEIFDFQTAMNTVRRAQEAFMMLPSGIRARFQNNPHLFTEYFSHEENRPEAERMGLVIPKPPKAPEAPPEPGSGTP